MARLLDHPGWTDYSRRILYQTYDVTGLLAEGENVIGAIRHADLLMGERHDLGLEPAAWAAPGFGADGWRPGRQIPDVWKLPVIR